MAEKSNAQVALEAAIRIAQAKIDKGFSPIVARPTSVLEDAKAYLAWLQAN